VGFSGAIMPGPLLTVTIDESYRRGFSAAPKLVAGHAVLEGGMVTLVGLGLAKVINNDVFFGVVALGGGAFLIWMGLDMVVAVRRGKIALDLESHGRTKMGPFAAGLTTSLANPYWSLWWATFGLTWLGKALERGVPGAVFFYAGHISADIIWYFLVAFLVVSGRRYISDRVYRYIIVGSGLFLLVLGAKFVSDGLTRLLC
jgi:threonine/homoserine/homoserine lactone efflux protein